MRFKKPPELAHALAELTDYRVGTVTTQNLGLGRWRSESHFIGVAQNELARFQQRLLRVRARHPAPFNGGMADTVSETESLSFGRQRVTVLAPNHGDTV